MSNVRIELQRFSEIMEQKLQENDHKGHWKGCNLGYLTRRLKEEVRELEEKISLYKQDIAMGGRSVGEGLGLAPTPQTIHEEAADVANFAMMIAYVTNPQDFTK